MNSLKEDLIAKRAFEAPHLTEEIFDGIDCKSDAYEKGGQAQHAKDQRINELVDAVAVAFDEYETQDHIDDVELMLKYAKISEALVNLRAYLAKGGE